MHLRYSKINDLKEVLKDAGYPATPESAARMFFGQMALGEFNYMEELVSIFPPQVWLKPLLVRMVDLFPSYKDFFSALAGNPRKWEISDLYRILT